MSLVISLSYLCNKFITITLAIIFEQDSCHTDSAEAKGRLNVVVIQSDLKRSNSAVESGIACYNMAANPRGHALIIEIEEYINDVQEKRVGSEVRRLGKRNLWSVKHLDVFSGRCGESAGAL